MSKLLAAIALAGVIWSCDARAAATAPPAPAADGPTYTERVKIDDV